ncbi:MAG TPA: hypothetical protein VGH89_11885 [Pseudonocardia sp.]|jgi:hypothetical protein
MTDPRGPWGPLAEPMHVDKEIGPDDPPWRENVFLSFADRAQRCFVIAHLQGGRTDAGMFARVSVLQDDHLTQIYEPLPPMTFSSEHVSFDLAGQLRAKSEDLQLELTLTPVREPIDYSRSAALPGLKKSEPLRHYEQGGRFTGSVTTRWGSLEVAGSVIRDRTWGWRQEIASWSEYYASFLAFDDFDLAVMKFSTLTGDVPAHGALVGGRTGTVTQSSVRRRDETGSIVELDLVLADGSPLNLRLGKPEARIFCPLNDPQGPVAFTAYDDLVEVRTGDGAVGFGIMEQGILRRQV